MNYSLSAGSSARSAWSASRTACRYPSWTSRISRASAGGTGRCMLTSGAASYRRTAWDECRPISAASRACVSPALRRIVRKMLGDKTFSLTVSGPHSALTIPQAGGPEAAPPHPHSAVSVWAGDKFFADELINVRQASSCRRSSYLVCRGADFAKPDAFGGNAGYLIPINIRLVITPSRFENVPDLERILDRFGRFRPFGFFLSMAAACFKEFCNMCLACGRGRKTVGPIRLGGLAMKSAGAKMAGCGFIEIDDAIALFVAYFHGVFRNVPFAGQLNSHLFVSVVWRALGAVDRNIFSANGTIAQDKIGWCVICDYPGVAA